MEKKNLPHLCQLFSYKSRWIQINQKNSEQNSVEELDEQELIKVVFSIFWTLMTTKV